MTAGETFQLDTGYPPSLEGHPYLYMLAVAGLLAGVLITLQWLYRSISEWAENPLTWRHPAAASKAIVLLLLFAALALAVPRLILVMSWAAIAPETRQWLSLASWMAQPAWAAILSVAWWIEFRSRADIRFQLMREPRPESMVAPRLKIRGFIILGLILVIAFATTFVRPQPHGFYSTYAPRSG